MEKLINIEDFFQKEERLGSISVPKVQPSKDPLESD